MGTDIVGSSFGNWKVIYFYGNDKNQKNKLFLCRCSCGKEKVIRGTTLLNGNSKSCGCLRKKLAREKGTKHGMFGTKFYYTWRGIKQRCNDTKQKYFKDYGGRGITYDPRWNDFLEFKKDMYQSYVFAKKEYRKVLSKNNPLSIERKDVNDNYYKENCCWIPMSEQHGNTRTNRLFEAISPNGIKKISRNQKKFAEKHNLNKGSINSCLMGREKSTGGWRFKFIEEEHHI